MVDREIAALVQYALDKGLIQPADRTWAVNQLLAALGLDSFEEPQDAPAGMELETILGRILDDAASRGFIEEGVTSRDLLDTKLMGILTPRPSQVIDRFRSLEAQDKKAATDWYYTFSQDTDYIRRYRIARDVKWVTRTEYGDLDITINLSKPEKDPRAIAAAKSAPQGGYPKCQLCRENEGYAGRVNHPARGNHRVIPVAIDGKDWFLQYSPYVYYNEHCIVFNGEHTPMKIDRSAFRKLLDFVMQYPHYFVGSNADLPIVGGSILSHDHFQGGRYTFAMERAPVEREVRFPGFEDVSAGIVHWPCPSCACAALVTDAWWTWRKSSLRPGGATPMRPLSSMPKPTGSLTIPLPPSPGCGTASTSWTWCSATILPLRSTPWASTTPTPSCTISKRRTSG